MSKSRERKLAQKRHKRKQKQKLQERASRQSSFRVLSKDEQNLGKEVEHIIKCAEKGECHVVGFRELVLFSTTNGDAWLLDSDGHLALCLMVGSERREVHIEETRDNFAIGWEAHYEIDGDTFVVQNSDGETQSIAGYPASDILDTVELARKHGKS